MNKLFLLAACVLPVSTQAASSLTITRTSGPTFYIESTSPASLCAYTSYKVYNNSGSDIADVWATLTSFSNVNLHMSANDPNLTHVGAIPSHVTKTAFFYVCADAVVGTAITHNLEAYASSVTSGAGATLLNTTGFSYTGVVEGTETGSTPINSLGVQPNPPILGGTVTIAVSATAGSVSNGGFISFSPASFVNWPANVFQLESTSVTLLNKNTGTYADQLYVSGLNNGNSTDYSVLYTFRVVSMTASATTANPKSYIDSGTIKETDPTTTGFQPVSAPSNTLTLALAVIPNPVAYPELVAVTITVTNSGANSINLDGFRFTLPSSPGTPVIQSGSSKFQGVATGNPSDLGGGLWGWDGIFAVPANSSVKFTFVLSLPNINGSYPLTATAKVGILTIDTTTSTTDYAPATATLVQQPITPTFTQSPTVTVTPTSTLTLTLTASPQVTPSSTPTASPTTSDSPTASHTPTLTQTSSATPTETDSPTPSITPTASDVFTATESPTVSPTPSETQTHTPVPPTHDDLSFKLGKVPSKAGQPICMYSNNPIADCEWTVFGPDQQVVARLRFVNEQPCFTETQTLAPGVYIVRIKTRDIYGHSSNVVRLFLIES